MVVQAYTVGFGEILGQIQKNIDFLPKLQNGFYLNPIADIQSNIASVGADPTQAYWIDWDLTLFISETAKNGPVLQSPLQNTYQAIVAFISKGAVTEQLFVNFPSQRFPFRGFWNLSPATAYPSEPTSPISGEVGVILSSFSTASKSADSVCIYPQYAVAPTIEAFVSFRATLGQPEVTFIPSDFPSLFTEIL